MQLSPGFEPGAQVRSVLLNGKPLQFAAVPGEDVHCSVEFKLTGRDEVYFGLIPGLQILEPADVPDPGDSSQQLKILRVSWDRAAGQYTLDLEGRSGRTYPLELRTPRKPMKVDGARWEGSDISGVLKVEFPPASQQYVRRTVTILLADTK